MSDQPTGTLADMFSLPAELEHNGKTYPIRPPNPLEQGKFQRWLEDRARDAIDRLHRDDLDAKARAYADLADRAAVGHYEWGGEVATRAMFTESGAAKLVSLVANIPEAEAKAVIATHKMRIDSIFQAAVADDPKALAEALKKLGLPPDILNPTVKPSSKEKTSSAGSGTRRSTKRKKKSHR